MTTNKQPLRAAAVAMMIELRRLRDTKPDAWDDLVDPDLCDAWDDLKAAIAAPDPLQEALDTMTLGFRQHPEMVGRPWSIGYWKGFDLGLVLANGGEAPHLENTRFVAVVKYSPESIKEVMDAFHKGTPTGGKPVMSDDEEISKLPDTQITEMPTETQGSPIKLIASVEMILDAQNKSQWTKAELDGTVFYVRENSGSGEKWLELCAPEAEWGKIAGVVLCEDSLKRKVLKNEEFTVELAEKVFADAASR